MLISLKKIKMMEVINKNVQLIIQGAKRYSVNVLRIKCMGLHAKLELCGLLLIC